MTTSDTLRRPPYDPELAAALSVIGEQLPPTLTPDMIPAIRQAPHRPHPEPARLSRLDHLA